MVNTNERIKTAVIPVPKLEKDCYDWWARHEQVLLVKDKIDPEVVLIGDSLTHFWEGDPAAGVIHGSKEAWYSVFAPYRVLNLGFGWDRTQNVLWRLDYGEMEGLDPKVVVILIGTNNTSETENARANDPDEIAEGLCAICDRIHDYAPKAAIVIMAILPREEMPNNPRRKQIEEINTRYAKLAKDRQYDFVDIGPSLLEADGTLSQHIAFDFCHLTELGYQIWADALRPLLRIHV
jgi:lysophospholipase L1-like esterase